MESPAGEASGETPALSRRSGRLVVGLIFVLYLLHNDFWNQGEPRFWLGIPAGLLYHLALCLVASLLFWLLVTIAWPQHLQSSSSDENS